MRMSWWWEGVPDTDFLKLLNFELDRVGMREGADLRSWRRFRVKLTLYSVVPPGWRHGAFNFPHPCAFAM
jgi:hypothetical protein